MASKSLYKPLFLMKPLKIGLTGGISTGKTMVSNLFAKMGIPIIDADEIARKIVEPGQPALEQIIQSFGTSILKPDGHLNRAKLRQQILEYPQQRQRLEAILHPPIRQIMQTQATSITKSYCILSIPLLIETQQMDLVDRILVIDCPQQLQRQRLQQRDGMDLIKTKTIINLQAKRETRLAIANEVIYNDSDIQGLTKQVIALHQWYKTIWEKEITKP